MNEVEYVEKMSEILPESLNNKQNEPATLKIFDIIKSSLRHVAENAPSKNSNDKTIIGFGYSKYRDLSLSRKLIII